MSISYSLLSKQDDQTSSAVVALLAADPSFVALSASEGADIKKRDDEDDTKLAVGINISVARGVIPKDPNVGTVTKIPVHGKTADQVAQEILAQLPSQESNVIILQGLSGTGKGTTVKKLQAALPNCVTWSNGNVFRSITHIVSADLEASGAAFGSEALTADAIKGAVRRLEFKKFDDGFDVIIDGATRVRDVQNTLLKRPIISQRVPTVAEQTQGEVITFGAAAVEMLKEAGCNVILEGRAQTLNYIPSSSRFELTIDDLSLLGQRRAAQRVMAAALGAVNKDSSDEEVTKAVEAAAATLQ